jgi:hypothetical protein
MVLLCTHPTLHVLCTRAKFQTPPSPHLILGRMASDRPNGWSGPLDPGVLVCKLRQLLVTAENSPSFLSTLYSTVLLFRKVSSYVFFSFLLPLGCFRSNVITDYKAGFKRFSTLPINSICTYVQYKQCHYEIYSKASSPAGPALFGCDAQDRKWGGGRQSLSDRAIFTRIKIPVNLSGVV